MEQTRTKGPWFWIPSLYFAEGIPYIVVMTLSVILYKRLGISNTDIALYTSWLYLPWIIKPLWSPIVDMLKTKRFWIVTMQLLIGAGLAGVAFTIPTETFFQYTLAFFWLLAFSSATHDIAADGFYMLGLSDGDQAYFVGIRSTFYRIAMLTGQGLLVILAGSLESATGLAPLKVEINTNDKAIEQITFNPDQYTVDGNATNDLYFVSPEEIVVSYKNAGKQYVDELSKSINEWNIQNGFYSDPEKITQEPSRWSRHVSTPLKQYLKQHFNHKLGVTNSEITGNIAIIPIQLSQKPAEDVILNFGFEKGNTSIKLAKAYRFEFNNDNWDKPAFALVQLDSKLNKSVKASFVGRSGNIKLAWSVVFLVIAGLFVVLALYHKFALPKPASDKPNISEDKNPLAEFIGTFVSFFKKPGIGVAILFMLLYRLSESQLVKLATPFLIDSKEAGGLGITTGDLGIVYGTAGIIALTIGGILGGIVASKKGLKYWLWWMAMAINLPNVTYLLLSIFKPDSLWYITSAVVIEQFGYGFGFTAYMLFMIYISEGKSKTAHFAITTAFMATGMMLPGMLSGWLQDIIGYQSFFIWVLICTIPIFLVIPFLKINKQFGIKKKNS